MRAPRWPLYSLAPASIKQTTAVGSAVVRSTLVGSKSEDILNPGKQRQLARVKLEWDEETRLERMFWKGA